MNYNILSESRREFIPYFKDFKDSFYLAGGTALALQIGHRDSVDFDFFSMQAFDREKIFKNSEQIFKNYNLTKIKDEDGSLIFLVNKDVQVSFLEYSYNLVKPLVQSEYMQLADVIDIGCMKLSAILSRATFKDYVDLYFILQNISLGDLLKYSAVKYPSIDEALILKSLVYFEDVPYEPLMFTQNNEISFEKIKYFLSDEVKKQI